MESATGADVQGLANGCKAFRQEYGVYPPEDGWLTELHGAGNAVVNHRRLVFVFPNTMSDAWGNPFVYRLPGTHNTNLFDLYSMGEDARSETGGNDRQPNAARLSAPVGDAGAVGPHRQLVETAAHQPGRDAMSGLVGQR